MNRITRKLSTDDGFGVVEVVVAMVLFGLIITGTLYTMLSVLQTTRDSRAQQVAANLAAQDIDLARDYDDLFALLPTSYTVPLNGDVFTVTRQTQWVNGNGNDVKCGSGGAALSYKRVNVVVTWANMRTGGAGVRADTVIDPNSRITDPTKGTILVFVKTDGGAGSAGVTVKATPSAVANGAVTPSPSTAVTDASGCAYILKVEPGNYDISLSHSSNGYVDENQGAAPTKILGVQKNATASVGFQYDRAGTITVAYASNWESSVRPSLPANMPTTFSNTYGSWQLPRQTEFKLHPFAAGYQVLAGNDAACLANDSQEWKPSGSTPAAPPLPTVTALAGQSASVGVPMGVIRFNKTSSFSGSDRYLRAVSVDSTSNGNPGCATEQVLRWSGRIVPSGSSGTFTVAVPAGSWRFFFDQNENTTGTNGLAQESSSLTQLTNAGGTGIVGSLTGVVTVDPRVK